MKRFICVIAFIFLFCNSGLAQNWQFIDIQDFSGGLNTRDGAGGIADNELQSSNNTYLLAKGIAKRKGYTDYNGNARVTTSEQGTGIYYAPFITAGAKIVATAGDSIKYKGTNVWTDITGSVTITADKPMLFTMINNNMVCVNGTDKPVYWSGAGNADSLSGDNIFTAPTACETFHGRLFLAEGRRLRWSNYMGDWKIFHPDDYQDVEETITGIKVYGDVNESNLIIFTDRSIYSCTFDPQIGVNIGGRGTFRFNVISSKHGCISPYSIQECITEDGNIVLIWADNDGLKALFGNSVIKLTDKIQPDWDGLNFSQLDESIGIHYKPKRWYLLSCADGTSTTNNKVIVYDLRNWAVSGFFDWAISSWTVIRASGEDKLIGSNYTGYWKTYDDGDNDDGVAIDSYFETKSFGSNDPIYDKGFVSVGIQLKYEGEYDIELAIFYDFDFDVYATTYTPTVVGGRLGSFLLDESRLGGAGALAIGASEITGHGRNAHIKVANSAADEPFTIYGLNLIYKRDRPIIAY